MIIDELYSPNRETIEITTALSDLCTLSLVSVRLNRLAYRHLHSHVFLPTLDRMHSFVRTAQSDRWRRSPDGQRLEQPRRAGLIWNCGSKGRGAKGDASVSESELVGNVLDGLGRDALARVELTSLPVDSSILGGLSRLAWLQLESVGLVIEPGPVRLALPLLRALHIRNLVCSTSHKHRNDADPGLLINAAVLPALQYLTLASSDRDFRVRHPFRLGCSTLFARLTSLRLAGHAGWWGLGSDAFWLRLRALKVLVLQPWDAYVAAALRLVPSELDELHLDADETEEPDERDEEVLLEWDDDACKCLAKLKELHLPERGSWGEDVMAARPAGWLGHMEAHARARGVKVKFD